LIVLPSQSFRSLKPEIRVVGIDDGRFIPRTKGVADVVGVVYRGTCWFEGVMHTTVTIDGLDSTEKIATMVKDSLYFGELRVILLDGVTFAGFNVVNISDLFRKLNLPVISVTRDKPDLVGIKKALRNLPDFETRWRNMTTSGDLFAVQTRRGENPVYVQTAGISHDLAEKLLKQTSVHSNIPEALRVAHLVASSLFR
jgi:endonuclease V-like protein UPF0215 family